VTTWHLQHSFSNLFLPAQLSIFSFAGPLRCASGTDARNVTMATGTVKWFNATKGFGFIQPDDGGPDAFVHISAVERSGLREITEGQKIGYDMERDSKSGKMSACNLQAA
jgi:CspA family cold shock protein